MIEKSESTDKSVDPVRLAALYAEHGTGLRRLAFGVLHDWQAAEDVVQAAFAKAAQSAGDVRPEAIKSWLHRVAFHEAITWKRRIGVDRRPRPLAPGSWPWRALQARRNQRMRSLS